MTKNMKLEELKNIKLVADLVGKPNKQTIHFKDGLKFVIKNGRISGIYPRYYKGQDLLKEHFGKREEEIISINAKVLKLNQVQYLRTITTDDYVIKINRNDAVYDIDNEKLFHFVVGQPAKKAMETIECINEEWPIDPEE